MNRIMRKIVLWICLLVTSVLYAQETSLSVKLSQGHPRYLTDSNGKVETQKLIKEESRNTELLTDSLFGMIDRNEYSDGF